jgi:GNAT superfamily N-acetyltransferase
MANPELTQDPPMVEVLTDVTPAVVEDFQRLIPQVSNRPVPPAEVVEANLLAATNPENKSTRVFVVRDPEGRIQATLTGTICRIPTGEKSWADDLVTDQEHRGNGYGAILFEALEEWFGERGVDSVNFTSNASRVAAGSLFEKAGYRERVTRVYRKYLGRSAASETIET